MAPDHKIVDADDVEFIAWICSLCEQQIEPGTEVFVQNPPKGYGYGTEDLICQPCDSKDAVTASAEQGQ